METRHRRSFCLGVLSIVASGCLSSNKNNYDKPDIVIRNNLNKNISINIAVNESDGKILERTIDIGKDSKNTIQEIASSTGTYYIQANAGNESVSYTWTVTENEVELDAETVEIGIGNRGLNIGKVSV